MTTIATPRHFFCPSAPHSSSHQVSNHTAATRHAHHTPPRFHRCPGVCLDPSGTARLIEDGTLLQEWELTQQHAAAVDSDDTDETRRRLGPWKYYGAKYRAIPYMGPAAAYPVAYPVGYAVGQSRERETQTDGGHTEKQTPTTCVSLSLVVLSVVTACSRPGVSSRPGLRVCVHPLCGWILQPSRRRSGPEPGGIWVPGAGQRRSDSWQRRRVLQPARQGAAIDVFIC